MSENTAKQSEILFIWDARMCNPNGDMSADNAPRFDEVDEKAIVSDVRLKRTIRDDLQYRKGQPIFINNEEIIDKKQSAEDRYKQLKEAADSDDELNVFLSCLDNRLFGGVAPKSGLQLVGTVQFGWTKSLNKTETIMKQGTGGFAQSGKNQKTFRVDNYLPYALFAAYGSVNGMQAVRNRTQENDVQLMLDSLWYGTKFLNTRSKEGQKPRMMLRVSYKEGSKYFIGLLDELVSLTNDDSEMIRSIGEADIDFSHLVAALGKAEKMIEKVEIVLDPSLDHYRNVLEKIPLVDIIDEIQLSEK
jgi:CRISPR-associated protein Csh2